MCRIHGRLITPTDGIEVPQRRMSMKNINKTSGKLMISEIL
jgi:hypothetical protein